MIGSAFLLATGSLERSFEYEVMLDRYEEVYHHVVGDPLKAMPSTLKKGRVPAGAKA